MNANVTNPVPQDQWEGHTWNIHAASAGLQTLLTGGQPAQFQLIKGADGSYSMQPPLFNPTGPLTPAGVVSTQKLNLETLKDQELASLAPADRVVQMAWNAHKLITAQPLLSEFVRLEGTATIDGEEHFVDLYQIGNVFKDPDSHRSLLVMRFMTIEDDSNSDGWAIGNN
jgi:hypothetical protein